MNLEAEKTTLSSHARLTILGYLNRANGYTLNCEVLKSLLHSYGIIISSSELNSDLKWLENAKLIRLHENSDLGYSITIARLTEKGADIYIGAEEVEGVAKSSIKLLKLTESR